MNNILKKIIIFTIFINQQLFSSSGAQNLIKALENIEIEIQKSIPFNEFIQNVSAIEMGLNEQEKNDLKRMIISKYESFKEILGINKLLSNNLEGQRNASNIQAVALDPKYEKAFSAYFHHDNCKIRSWNIREENITIKENSQEILDKTLDLEKTKVSSLTLDLDNSEILVGLGNGNLRVFSLSEPESVLIKLGNDPITSISVSPNTIKDFFFAIGTVAKLFRSTGFALKHIGTINHNGKVNCVAFSNCGNHIVSGDNLGVIGTGELKSKSIINQNFSDPYNASIEAIAISPDLKLILAGLANNKAILCNFGVNNQHAMTCHKTLDQSSSVKNVKFNTYGDLAIITSGSKLSIFNIANLESITLILEQDMYRGNIISMAVSNNLILTSTEDGSVQLNKLAFDLYSLSITMLAFLIKVGRIKPSFYQEEYRKTAENIEKLAPNIGKKLTSYISTKNANQSLRSSCRRYCGC